jgi:hypothetical protein
VPDNLNQCPALLSERNPMDEKTFNKTIGCAIVIILGYHIIGVFIPMLTWGVIVLIAFRIYQEVQKYKK